MTPSTAMVALHRPVLKLIAVLADNLRSLSASNVVGKINTAIPSVSRDFLIMTPYQVSVCTSRRMSVHYHGSHIYGHSDRHILPEWIAGAKGN